MRPNDFENCMAIRVGKMIKFEIRSAPSNLMPKLPAATKKMDLLCRESLENAVVKQINVVFPASKSVSSVPLVNEPATASIPPKLRMLRFLFSSQ